MSEKKQYRVRVTVESDGESIDLLGFTFTQGTPLKNTTVDAEYGAFDKLIERGMEDVRSFTLIGSVLGLWGNQLYEAMLPALKHFHGSELPGGDANE